MLLMSLAKGAKREGLASLASLALLLRKMLKREPLSL